MSNKPIFIATHPRACSTAFERVFLTRRDILNCVHEPFGDAFYFGPERLSTRYEDDEEARIKSGFADSTFKTIFDTIEREGKEGKRIFIKDIIHYLVPPNGAPASIAPSLGGKQVKKGVGTNGEVNGLSNGVTNGITNGITNGLTNAVTNGLTNGVANGFSNGITNGETNGESNGHHKTPYPYNTAPEPNNPTVVPSSILAQFHFTFLIRHPRYGIPSYYRCTIPPLNSLTGFDAFMPCEAGYTELRRVFDFLKNSGHIGPSIAGKYKQLKDGEVSITVIDADDLLDDPEGVIRAYCKEVGIDYRADMLNWDKEEDHERAREIFEKWRGFHEDAIKSNSLKPRDEAHKKKEKSVEVENKEWREKYGEEGQRVIRETVDANLADYEYLKTFAIKV